MFWEPGWGEEEMGREAKDFPEPTQGTSWHLLSRGLHELGL